MAAARAAQNVKKQITNIFPPSSARHCWFGTYEEIVLRRLNYLLNLTSNLIAAKANREKDGNKGLVGKKLTAGRIFEFNQII